MATEKNYDFLQRISKVHLPNRRDCNRVPAANEVEITPEWVILATAPLEGLYGRAVKDLQDYLLTSMELSLPIVTEAPAGRPVLEVKIDSAVKGCRMVTEAQRVTLSGNTDRLLFRCCVFLENRMNLAQGPILPLGTWEKEPLLRLRSVHSGTGIDDYPDDHLNAIFHAGYTAIELFVRGVDHTALGYSNINQLIKRAASFGLDVAFYNYMPSFKHPDDEGAQEFFDGIYGELVRKCPGAVAISLVGESLEFPSKDPMTTGKRWRDSEVDGIADTRPSPGWWPCEDYPRYLQRICDAIHKVDPKIEVIMNTYNWGYTPIEVRRRFLSTLPKEMTVHTTYEIFKINHREDLTCPVMDYTISAAEPGYYFTSECEAAAEFGLRLRATTNTTGSTWDFGTAPYAPVPYRWIKRLRTLAEAREKWGLDAHYENHHYGWTMNPAIELANLMAWSNPETSPEELLEGIARRDYGAAAAPAVLKCWKLWSDAMDHYISSNEDQYGPWRTGPSYPFLLKVNFTRTMRPKTLTFPASPNAHFGSSIIKTNYEPFENLQQSPGNLRYPMEIRELKKMLDMWNEGLESLKSVAELIADKDLENYNRLCALGLFIRNSIITTTHIKQWYRLNMALLNADCREQMLEILDKLEELAHQEIANALDTIPAVETDSRIGWEPSMEYVCDRWHLEWKVRQMESTLREINDTRTIVKL